jgi:hypothetical protein
MVQTLGDRKPIASVEQVITQKCFYAVGCVRLMLTLTAKEIEDNIDGYLDKCQDLPTLLKFSLGPDSPTAKTHLCSSENRYYSLLKG